MKSNTLCILVSNNNKNRNLNSNYDTIQIKLYSVYSYCFQNDKILTECVQYVCIYSGNK